MSAVLSSANDSVKRHLDVRDCAARVKGNPETLVAEMVAARRSEDRDRERAAQNKLQSQFGLKLFFADEMEAAHAK
jgi:hypothetical protein